MEGLSSEKVDQIADKSLIFL